MNKQLSDARPCDMLIKKASLIFCKVIGALRAALQTFTNVSDLAARLAGARGSKVKHSPSA